MDAKVTWNNGLNFIGVSESGFPISLDSNTDTGGGGQGLEPMELFAIGLAGCTAMDVISILGRKRQTVTAFEVRVQADRAEEHPKVFTRVHLEYIVTGVSIDPAAVTRAVQLSEEKYCPAQAMLRQAMPIEHSITIHEAEQTPN